ncbi:MAG TPA: MFS transporter [Bryobacteraceae bacterium]|nr:MFS transporter [Bryobacteraceae bacterium]
MMTASEQTSMTRKELNFAMAAVMLTMFTAVIDQAVMATALPRAAASLNGFARYSWPTTAFALCSTIATPILAKLSDQYGRKRVYLFSLFLFLVCAPMSAAAGRLPLPLDGMGQLIGTRALLGLANAGIIVVSYTLVADLFTPAGRARREGIIASVWTLGFIVGPSLGGVLSDRSSWRWALLASFPLGLAALVMVRCYLPAIASRRVRRVIDWPGGALICVWTAPFLISLARLGETGWSIRTLLAFLSISAVGFLAFLWTERRAREPIFVLPLFRDRRIALVCANLILTGVGLYGNGVYLPLFLQGVLGWTAANSALIFTPFMLGSILGNVVGGQLLSRTGRCHSAALFVSGLVAICLFLVSRMDATTTHVLLLSTVSCSGIGFGAVVLTYEVLAQNAAPQEHLGVATGYTQFSLALGGTIGLAILGACLLHAYHSYLDPLITAGTSPELARALENPLTLAFQNSGSVARYSQTDPGGRLLVESARSGLQFAVHRVFLVAAILAAAAFPLNLFLTKERSR